MMVTARTSTGRSIVAACVLVTGACSRPATNAAAAPQTPAPIATPPTATLPTATLPSSAPSSPNPGAAKVAPLARLRLAYFPDEERPGEPGVGRPTGSTRIAQQGQGCPKPTDEDRCGAFLLGDAGDLRPVELSCSTKTLTSAPPAAEALLATLRTAIRGHDKLKQESLAEVATLDIDGDGKKDRVLAASFEVVATADNLGLYDDPPRCQALLLDTGSTVIAVTEDTCKAPGTSQRLLQAFKLDGVDGVVLHIARQGGGSAGAFLVHVAQGRSTPLPLPPCDGNG